ncbi:hypothetical protein [Kutzneria sp. CA-103260]|uniref:hypothetical protein n=1 Tax=Kutzneria sp. CA-103260 TaxID=2802641 RepID=UPI001BA95DD3|nr:hypothetical protein [Kutzneria sp. CA-103260]QUQ63080.1 hypothetical protein JJ691_07920 [Kutzneria sp. CA-103260]
MTARGMAIVGGCALLAAVLVYGWGAEHMFTWDVAQACGYRQSYEMPVQYGNPEFLPLSLKCSATKDLVPAYVNPTVLALLVVTVACGVGSAFTAHVARRSARGLTGR